MIYSSRASRQAGLSVLDSECAAGELGLAGGFQIQHLGAKRSQLPKQFSGFAVVGLGPIASPELILRVDCFRSVTTVTDPGSGEVGNGCASIERLCRQELSGCHK